jgi:hypothetical protein
MKTKMGIWFKLFSLILLIAGLALAGCSGDDGAPGAPGAPGTSSGTLTGTVTSSASGTGLADVAITENPDIQGIDITTAANGTYSASLPVGVYTLTFTKNNFADGTETVSIIAGRTTTLNVQLAANSNVVVDAGANQTALPGDTVNVSAMVEPLDGSTVQSIVWTQSNSVAVAITDNGDGTASVTLPDEAAYKDELFNVLLEPPITADQLPPNITPPATFPEGLQDRFQVQGVNHFELEEAGLVTLVATVTTDSGVYTDEVEIHAELPWRANPGVRTVPVNEAVLVHGGTQGGTQAAWDWSLLGPVGSTATLDDTTAQNVSFVPDEVGAYTLTEANSGASLEINAGTWAGAITGQDAQTLPEADNCTICHNDIIAPDNFTPWRQSGHAEIFENNLNTSDHYGESCFECHTVGYNTAAVNNGMDDQSDYAAFLASDLLHTTTGDEWTTMLADFPNSARMANIQCEDCHGPNNAGGGHNNGESASRITLGAEMCGRCHGEPPRHGRSIQWQASPHANYELANDEGLDTNCSRCHTANGFIAWEDLGFDAGSEVVVTWTADDIHPQTCTACHDPHNPGNISGDVNNATVRVQDDTPVLAAGFQVLGAGRGAICMVCHNTRRGLTNDNNPDNAIVDGRAPHAGAQADVLMGQNGFFVQTGVRGKHSLITDTCANCHMVQTPPPALLSYNLGGTNHTFYASKDICAECHNSITADQVQAATMSQLSFLQTSIETAVATQLMAQAAIQDVFLYDADANADAEPDGIPDNTPLATITAGDTVVVTNFADSHGRQAVDVSINGGAAVHVQLQFIYLDAAAFPNIPRLLDNSAVAQTIAKSGWNYLMSTNERSHGIHNPTFTGQIIAGAQNALDTTDATSTAAP